VKAYVSGIELGCCWPPKEGATLRRDIDGGAKRLRDQVADKYRRTGDAALDLASQRAKETAERTRTAAARGAETHRNPARPSGR